MLFRKVLQLVVIISSLIVGINAVFSVSCVSQSLNGTEEDGNSR